LGVGISIGRPDVQAHIFARRLVLIQSVQHILQAFQLLVELAILRSVLDR
jgi:hypothetical protein